MKEYKRKTHNEKEQLNQEQHLSKKESRALSGNPHVWEQPGVSIMETPFEPEAGSHAALLAPAQSDDQRANMRLKKSQNRKNA